MTPEEIRNIPLQYEEPPMEVLLRELAAQLAELNFSVDSLREEVRRAGLETNNIAEVIRRKVFA